MEAGQAIWGWGVSRPEWFTIYHTRSPQGNMSGKSHGILRGENVPEWGNPASVPCHTVLWGTNGVARAAISIPHLYQ